MGEDDHVRGCVCCGWLTETLDEWAHHMVSEHDVEIGMNEVGEYYMSYEYDGPTA